MAKKQTMTFTALPNGVAGTGADKKVRLSVYIAPRLSNDTGSTDKMDLSAFGDWVNWPDTAKDITYKVSFNGGAGVTATPIGDPPTASLWGMLFGGTTQLVPHAVDQALTQTKIPLTYPSAPSRPRTPARSATRRCRSSPSGRRRRHRSSRSSRRTAWSPTPRSTRARARAAPISRATALGC